jgi:hypothetical protein
MSMHRIECSKNVAGRRRKSMIDSLGAILRKHPSTTFHSADFTTNNAQDSRILLQNIQNHPKYAPTP